PRPSDQPPRRHRSWFTGTDYNMVEHAYTDQLQCVAQLSGDVAVGRRWFGYAAWVVVGKDDGRRVVLKGRAYHFAGVDACAVQRTAEHFIKGQHPMPVVKK